MLAGAGLVTSERVGRETRFRLEPTRLRAVQEWIAGIGTAWDTRLSRLQRQLGEQT